MITEAEQKIPVALLSTEWAAILKALYRAGPDVWTEEERAAFSILIVELRLEADEMAFQNSLLSQ